MPATLVEFYDKSPIENVVSGLILKPGRIIYLGSNRERMERQMTRYQQLFEQRHIASELQCLTINKNNFPQIQKTIYDIALKNPECAIDLTGGDELSLVAVGAVAKSLEGQHISFHRVNIRTRKVIELFGPDPNEGSLSGPSLSVRENIALYGGTVVCETEREGATHIWDWSEDFCRDVGKMWEICKINFGVWNAQITDLVSLAHNDGLNVRISDIDGHSLNDEPNGHARGKAPWNNRLFSGLACEKLILNYRYEEGGVSFTYKNEQVKRCLTKAGQILELKTYLLTLGLASEDGGALINDAMTGVYIDWDSVVHQNGGSVHDTENEIDVLAMKGLIPYFISCKNGMVADDELYKLNTVAERFGGEYAKKVLVATYIDKNKDGLRAFRQRARDMNIELLDGVHMLDDAGFSKRLRSAFRA